MKKIYNKIRGNSIAYCSIILVPHDLIKLKITHICCLVLNSGGPKTGAQGHQVGQVQFMTHRSYFLSEEQK